MYLLVHIMTMNVPAGAYYYHELYLLVLIISMNVPAGAYY